MRSSWWIGPCVAMSHDWLVCGEKASLRCAVHVSCFGISVVVSWAGLARQIWNPGTTLVQTKILTLHYCNCCLPRHSKVFFRNTQPERLCTMALKGIKNQRISNQEAVTSKSIRSRPSLPSLVKCRACFTC